MRPWHDPNSDGNSPKHRSGRKCDECPNPAGTAWSPYWCWQCNAKRMDRLDASFKKLAEHFGIEDDE